MKQTIDGVECNTSTATKVFLFGNLSVYGRHMDEFVEQVYRTPEGKLFSVTYCCLGEPDDDDHASVTLFDSQDGLADYAKYLGTELELNNGPEDQKAQV